MRPARVVIGLLLLLNGAALIYWARPRGTAGRATHTANPLVVTQYVHVPPSALAGPADASDPTNSPFHWGQLETPDYRQYIARLRAIGCPEQTIRDLIIADLDKLYSARIRNLMPLRKQLNYWESEEAEMANNHDARSWQRREREIEREKAQVVKDLLGVDLTAERQRIRGLVDKYDRRLAFLPEDKRAELRGMLETWEEQEQAIREKAWDSGTVPGEEDRTRLRNLRIEREQALANSLSPEQREMFDLWMAPTAEALRHDLYGMGANEQEFKTLYDLRKEFDATWPRDEIDTSDSSTLESWGTALLDLEKRVQQVLGDDRFALYQRGQDSQFHELNSTASRSFLIDVYHDPSADGSGHGEGQNYAGGTSLTTSAGGAGSAGTA